MKINGHEVIGRTPIFKPELRDLVRRGLKTQTRRVVKGESLSVIDRFVAPVYSGIWMGYHGPTGCFTTKCPYGEKGDIRVMPEPLAVGFANCAVYADKDIDGSHGFVRLDGERVQWKWKGGTLSLMFMPVWAGRTIVKYIGIRVERLNEISANMPTRAWNCRPCRLRRCACWTRSGRKASTLAS